MGPDHPPGLCPGCRTPCASKCWICRCRTSVPTWSWSRPSSISTWPLPDHILSRETARLVLLFKQENGAWMIAHSGISIPYHLVRDGEGVSPPGPARAQPGARSPGGGAHPGPGRGQCQAGGPELYGRADGHRQPPGFRPDPGAGVEPGPAQRRSPGADHAGCGPLQAFQRPLRPPGGGTPCLQALAGVLTRAGRRGQRSGGALWRGGSSSCCCRIPPRPKPRRSPATIQQAIWALALPHEATAPRIVTVSLGIASVVPSREAHAETLVHQADEALYGAKRAGRNRLCNWRPPEWGR